MTESRPTTQPRPPPRPTWVKALALVAAAIVIAAVLMLVGGGEHSPSRHLPGDNGTGHTPPVEHRP